MKSADLYFTVPAEVPFWAPSQFEPLIVAIVFPLSHVARHTGQWLVKGTTEGEQTEQTLKHGFKGGDPDDPVTPHELEGILCSVWEDPERGARLALQQFLAWASNCPPVQKCLVWGLLLGSKQRPLYQTGQHRGGSKHQQSGD